MAGRPQPACPLSFPPTPGSCQHPLCPPKMGETWLFSASLFPCPLGFQRFSFFPSQGHRASLPCLMCLPPLGGCLDPRGPREAHRLTSNTFGAHLCSFFPAPCSCPFSQPVILHNHNGNKSPSCTNTGPGFYSGLQGVPTFSCLSFSMLLSCLLSLLLALSAPLSFTLGLGLKFGITDTRLEKPYLKPKEQSPGLV